MPFRRIYKTNKKQTKISLSFPIGACSRRGCSAYVCLAPKRSLLAGRPLLGAFDLGYEFDFERLDTTCESPTFFWIRAKQTIKGDRDTSDTSCCLIRSTPSILFYMTPLTFFFNFDQHYLIN